MKLAKKIEFLCLNRRVTPAFNTGTNVLESDVEYDPEYATLMDRRRKNVKKIKVISFSSNQFNQSIYIEPDNLVRQNISVSQFKKESADLLMNLSRYYHGHQPGSNPLKATLIGYRGKFKIKFENKEVYKFAAIAAVHDS